MPNYHVENYRTREAFLIHASDTQAACELLGWVPNECIFWIEDKDLDSSTLPVKVKYRRLSLIDPDNQLALNRLLAPHPLTQSNQGMDFSCAKTQISLSSCEANVSAN